MVCNATCVVNLIRCIIKSGSSFSISNLFVYCYVITVYTLVLVFCQVKFSPTFLLKIPMAILALCFSNETFYEEFVKSYYQFGWSFILIIDQCGRNPKQCIDSISKKQGVLFSIYSVFLLLFSALRF